MLPRRDMMPKDVIAVKEPQRRTATLHVDTSIMDVVLIKPPRRDLTPKGITAVSPAMRYDEFSPTAMQWFHKRDNLVQPPPLHPTTCIEPSSEAQHQ